MISVHNFFYFFFFLFLYLKRKQKTEVIYERQDIASHTETLHSIFIFFLSLMKLYRNVPSTKFQLNQTMTSMDLIKLSKVVHENFKSHCSIISCTTWGINLDLILKVPLHTVWEILIVMLDLGIFSPLIISFSLIPYKD